MIGVCVVLGALAVALAFGLYRKIADGRIRTVSGTPLMAEAERGTPLGDRATLLQFSSPACAPCTATARILAKIAGESAGVIHVEIDVSDHPELIAKYGILRTPTVFVLDASGAVLSTCVGAPKESDVRECLGALQSPSISSTAS